MNELKWALRWMLLVVAALGTAADKGWLSPLWCCHLEACSNSVIDAQILIFSTDTACDDICHPACDTNSTCFDSCHREYPI